MTDETKADSRRVDGPAAVSLLGLGAMGSALARALIAAGQATTVWNRSSDKVDPLVELGAVRAATAEAAVAASPVTIICVVDDAAFNEVVGLTQSGLEGRVLINLTNSTPQQARAASNRAQQAGATGFLDGGIMAVPPMIGASDALILYSGSHDAFEVNRNMLDSLGASRYVGADPGLASLYDLALLTGMYGMYAGVLHAVALGKTEQVHAATLMELMVPWLEAMASGLPELAHQIDSASHSGDSPLAMQSAALANIVATSKAQGVSPELVLPMERLVNAGVNAGHGDDDLSALHELLLTTRSL